jgi:hypothetical protein
MMGYCGALCFLRDVAQQRVSSYATLNYQLPPILFVVSLAQCGAAEVLGMSERSAINPVAERKMMPTLGTRQLCGYLLRK